MCNPHADPVIPDLARAPSWLNASERLQKKAQERRRHSLEAIAESSLSPGDGWSRIRTSVGVRRNSITGAPRVIVRPKTAPMRSNGATPQEKPRPRKPELPEATRAATKRAEKAAKAAKEAEEKKEANQRQLEAEAAKRAEEEAWARR